MLIIYGHSVRPFFFMDFLQQIRKKIFTSLWPRYCIGINLNIYRCKDGSNFELKIENIRFLIIKSLVFLKYVCINRL